MELKLQKAKEIFDSDEDFNIGCDVLFANPTGYKGKLLKINNIVTVLGTTNNSLVISGIGEISKSHFIKIGYNMSNQGFEAGDFVIDRLFNIYRLNDNRTYNIMSTFGSSKDYSLSLSAELRLLYRPIDNNFTIKSPSDTKLLEKGWVAYDAHEGHPVYGNPLFKYSDGSYAISVKASTKLIHNAAWRDLYGNGMFSLMDMIIKPLVNKIQTEDIVTLRRKDNCSPKLQLSMEYTVYEIIKCGANTLVILTDQEGERFTTNIKYLRKCQKVN